MKSLLLSGVYFPPQVGGISRIMERLAITLGRERICCLTGAGPGAATLGEGGPRVYRNSIVFSDVSRSVRALAWGRVIGSIIVRERPGALLLATVNDGLIGRRLSRWLRLPYVIYTHGNEICAVLSNNRLGGSGGIARDVLIGADQVLANSSFTAGLVSRVGVDPRKIEVVYPGCDTTLFTPAAPESEFRRRVLGDRNHDRILLTIGNLVPRKGHDMVIRALAELRPTLPDVTYLIVGDGPHRSELERLATALGVRERVVFAGRVPDAELPKLYALADVFVMASRFREEENDVEGFGLVFLEANACGKPVIGGRSGGIPEAVIDGETGLLVDPTDPRDIARALARVLSDAELASRLGSQGHERVASGFTWARTADRVQGVLERVAGRASSPTSSR